MAYFNGPITMGMLLLVMCFHIYIYATAFANRFGLTDLTTTMCSLSLNFTSAEFDHHKTAILRF